MATIGDMMYQRLFCEVDRPLRKGELNHQPPVVAREGHQAEEIEDDLTVDRTRHGDDEVDDDVAGHVRQHLAEEDVPRAEIEDARRLDVLPLLEREHLGAHRPQQRRPGNGGDDECEQNRTVELDEGRQHAEKDDVGDRQHDVGEQEDG